MARERPLFLARRSYRRRRMMDGARLLPVFGALMLLLPALWWPAPRPGGAMVWMFAVWALLVVLAFGLSRGLASALAAGEDALDLADPDPRAGPGDMR